MEIKYNPNLGIEINSEKIIWNESRENIRIKLTQLHKEDDKEIDNSEFFDGDNSFNILQKRDVYQNLNDNQNLFFFNYDDEDKLCEIEFHIGIQLTIEEVKIVIGEEINKIIEKLKYPFIENEGGNYFFQELKLNIASDEFMGGEGNGLSYIFITKNELEID